MYSETKPDAAVARTAATFDSFAVDCAITVALKITDDTCKMNDAQRALFMQLYDALGCAPSELFDADIHDLIAAGRTAPTPELLDEIGRLRTMAMERITRPKMKAFKAAVRASVAEHR
jgi:hypothetical protein